MPILKASVHIKSLRQDGVVKLVTIFSFTTGSVPLKYMSTSLDSTILVCAPGGWVKYDPNPTLKKVYNLEQSVFNLQKNNNSW